jgi:hypothetical protein
MPAAEEEPCHKCGHQRKYHHPEECTFEDCACIGFSEMRVDPATARTEADTYLRQAVFALRQAFSSDLEIKEEMYNGVDRVLPEE